MKDTMETKLFIKGVEIFADFVQFNIFVHAKLKQPLIRLMCLATIDIVSETSFAGMIDMVVIIRTKKQFSNILPFLLKNHVEPDSTYLDVEHQEIYLSILQ